MKKEEPDRYLRLEHWLQKGAAIDPRDLYPAGSSKEKRRAEIANMLIPEVSSFLPSGSGRAGLGWGRSGCSTNVWYFVDVGAPSRRVVVLVGLFFVWCFARTCVCVLCLSVCAEGVLCCVVDAGFRLQ